MSSLKLQSAKAPHIRHTEKVNTMMSDVILALVPLLAIALAYYGLRALWVCLVSVITCDASDRLCLLLQKKRRTGNASAIVTGMIIGLMMPVTVPYYVVVAAGLFAIVVVKHPFGGLGNNVFNPACGGLGFAMLCWRTAMTMYPDPQWMSSWTANAAVMELSPSPANAIMGGNLPSYSLDALIVGNFRGPMGTTCVLVILACFSFLLVRRAVSWHIPVSFLVSAALFVFINPNITGAGRLDAVLLQLCYGSTLFAAIFIAGDPVTSPAFPAAKIMFGAGCGLLSMLLRYVGVFTGNAFPEGIVFAILIMNMFSGFLDKLCMDAKIENGWLKRFRSKHDAYMASEEYQHLLAAIEMRKEMRKSYMEERKERFNIKRENRFDAREANREARQIKMAEQNKLKAEQTAARQAAQEEARRKKGELTRQKAEERAKLKAMQEQLKAAERQRRKDEQEKRKAEEAAQKAEEARKRADALAAQKAEQERLDLEKREAEKLAAQEAVSEAAQAVSTQPIPDIVEELAPPVQEHMPAPVAASAEIVGDEPPQPADAPAAQRAEQERLDLEKREAEKLAAQEAVSEVAQAVSIQPIPDSVEELAPPAQEHMPAPAAPSAEIGGDEPAQPEDTTEDAPAFEPEISKALEQIQPEQPPFAESTFEPGSVGIGQEPPLAELLEGKAEEETAQKQAVDAVAPEGAPMENENPLPGDPAPDSEVAPNLEPAFADEQPLAEPEVFFVKEEDLIVREEPKTAEQEPLLPFEAAKKFPAPTVKRKENRGLPDIDISNDKAFIIDEDDLTQTVEQPRTVEEFIHADIPEADTEPAVQADQARRDSSAGDKGKQPGPDVRLRRTSRGGWTSAETGVEGFRRSVPKHRGASGKVNRGDEDGQ